MAKCFTGPLPKAEAALRNPSASAFSPGPFSWTPLASPLLCRLEGHGETPGPPFFRSAYFGTLNVARSMPSPGKLAKSLPSFEIGCKQREAPA
jgi:hypothetical protein